MTTYPQAFPATRMRRLRQSPWVRSLVAENVLTPADLVWAAFIHDGEGRVPVGSLPGIDRLSVTEAAKAAKRAEALGIPAIALFPYIGPDGKDEEGTGA
ncbi:MAG: porphobilinogen synthase, partial [Hyphomonas sp.]|nr:porphobilinogen synthase [Hyphomonas sp.]